jgi:phosphate acetyltransferase
MITRVTPNQVPVVEERLAQRKASWPQFILPEVEMLAKPTAAQLADAIEARPLFVDTPNAPSVVANCRVAAMQLTHFLKYIGQGSLVITPGDRTDVILAALASRNADTYPNISGIILTGNLEPEPDVMRLLEGLRPLPLPLYLTTDDTYTTAMKVHTARPRITNGDDAKVSAALGVFADSVEIRAFKRAIES